MVLSVHEFIYLDACIEYEENIIQELPDNNFSVEKDCERNPSYLKFGKGGWDNCEAGNSITVDFGKQLTITMLKMAGSKYNGKLKIVTKFKVRYSQGDGNWNLIYKQHNQENVSFLTRYVITLCH